MTTSTGATVRLSPPSPALMRVINPVVRRVLSAPRLGRRIGAMMLLEFTGRRTGRTIRIPIALHMIDGVPMVFTDRRWRLNLSGGAPVTVTHRGQVRRGHGVLLQATPEQVGSALRAALDSGTSPFVLGLKIARSHDPTVADLSAVDLSLVQLHLDAPSRSGHP
jgi:hypothetical protein